MAKYPKQQPEAPKEEPTVVHIVVKEEKDVIWWPEKLTEEIKNDWPFSARKDIGFELGKVQQGLEPTHFREMPQIGPGVREIKVQDESRTQFRLIFVAKFEEGIYVFHVITGKKTQKTDQADIEIAKKRYNEIVEQRKKLRQKMI